MKICWLGMNRHLLQVISLRPFFLKTVIYGKKNPSVVWVVYEDIFPILWANRDSITYTPSIDRLARDWVIYTKAYTTAEVCAPFRSSIVKCIHTISIGAQHIRTLSSPPLFMSKGLTTYSIDLPKYVNTFPKYLRAHSYYTTNIHKEDYQFEEPVTVWVDSSPASSYKYQPKNTSFFTQFNLTITQESKLMVSPDSIGFDSHDIKFPPYHVDTETTGNEMAVLHNRYKQRGQGVGEIVGGPKKEIVYEDSFVIFTIDNGECMARTKLEIIEIGTYIPWVVKYPKNRFSGTKYVRLDSVVELAPTMLSIVGIEPADHLCGTTFLGPFKKKEKRKYIFAARDQMSTKYGKVRPVSVGNHRYVYNYMPELLKYQDLQYRKGIPTKKEILELHDMERLVNLHPLIRFSKNKPTGELYCAKMDPNEVRNLVDEPKYVEKKKELKEALFGWIAEKEMVFNNWWKKNTGYTIEYGPIGASIGYHIVDQNISVDSVDVPQPWKVYHG